MKILPNVSQNIKNKYFYLLLVLLVGLVVADGLVTRFVIKNSLGAEANPFLQEWVQSDSLLIIKLAGSIIAALILWRFYRRSQKTGWILTSIFVAVYSILIIWNIIAFYLARAHGIQ